MVRPAIEGAAQERERRRLDLLALRGEAHVVDLAVLGEPSLVASGGVRKAVPRTHRAALLGSELPRGETLSRGSRSAFVGPERDLERLVLVPATLLEHVPDQGEDCPARDQHHRLEPVMGKPPPRPAGGAAARAAAVKVNGGGGARC